MRSCRPVVIETRFVTIPGRGFWRSEVRADKNGTGELWRAVLRHENCSGRLSVSPRYSKRGKPLTTVRAVYAAADHVYR
jgi:hypothetical protein